MGHFQSKFLKNYDIQKLAEEYKKNSPVSHFVIDNFVEQELLQQLRKEMLSIPAEKWKTFSRRKSRMFEFNQLEAYDLSVTQKISHLFSSSSFILWLENITGITGLIADPHLTGAGFMRSFRGDSLKPHIDFNWNDHLRLHRKLSVILYIPENWEESWGGALNFYNEDCSKVEKSILPMHGRLLTWAYSKWGFHGYPEPLNCPAEYSRDGIRFFYYSSNSSFMTDDPPHKSLYWYDPVNKLAYNLET